MLQHISTEDEESILYIISTFEILKNMAISYILWQGHLSVRFYKYLPSGGNMLDYLVDPFNTNILSNS